MDKLKIKLYHMPGKPTTHLATMGDTIQKTLDDAEIDYKNRDIVSNLKNGAIGFHSLDDLITEDIEFICSVEKVRAVCGRV